MPCSFRLDRSKISGLDGRGAELGEGCQFGVPEDALHGHGNNQFCSYHLSLRHKIDLKIDADWFNKQVFGFVNTAKNDRRIVDLSGVHFPAAISFDGYAGKLNSLPDVLFVKAVFGGESNFCGTHFSGAAIFESAQFNGEANFRGANFSGPAIFLMAQFPGRPDFDEATFDGVANFLSAKFNREASFVRAEFKNRTEFRETEWHGDVQFDKATFDQRADFSNALFRGIGQFHEAVFRRKALFVGTAFGGEANFANARFDREAFFNAVTFGGPLMVHDATFGSDALFGVGNKGLVTRREIPGKLDIHDRISMASFRRTVFSGRADFSNRDFVGKTGFRDAIFKIAPEFYGAGLHQDTDFAGAKFLDHKGNDQVDAARAYRTLKLAMEQARATREQAMFFRHEQRSLRLRPDTRRSLKAISWLYEVSSDYGESPIRPLVGVGLAFVAFFLIYFAIQTSGKLLIGWAEISEALFFTAQQLFMPFRVFITNPPPPLGLVLLTALHSLLNISFIALFIIALRRKFRLV